LWPNDTSLTAHYDFTGRAAIVTGASSGIGLAAARRMVDEGAGVCLVAAPEDRDDLEAAGWALATERSRPLILAGDIGDPATAREAVSRTLDSFGRLDFLVANAGILASDDPLEPKLSDFDALWHVNVRGIYLAATEAARAMAERSGGSIVITASTAAILGQEGSAAYNATKGAVATLARSLAVDLAKYGIRVNAVAPGWVDTRQNASISENAAEWSRHRTHVPMDRFASPDEIASVMAFLLSDEASYVSGAVVPVDGGFSAGVRLSDWDTPPVPLPPRARRIWGRRDEAPG
jgi:NAD(P)-dependent dehydrogenase (short-subunit alcohol dehydrogenase family)